MTEPAKPPPSLHRKLVEIMAAVTKIEKRGRNSFHNYDYATESDVSEALRKELAARNVIILPQADRMEVVEVERAGKDSRRITYAFMQFSIVDADSGEVVVCPWIGAGEDTGEKGLYKAFTGGQKYFLMKTFLIPTGDDPERDEHKKRRSGGEGGEGQERPVMPACPSCGKREFVLANKPPKEPGWFCWKNEERKKLGCGHKWAAPTGGATSPAQGGAQPTSATGDAKPVLAGKPPAGDASPSSESRLDFHRRRLFAQIQQLGVLGDEGGKAALMKDESGTKARRALIEPVLKRDVVELESISDKEWDLVHEALAQRIKAASDAATTKGGGW